ncbi:MAG: substrate-binding domain-containing protein [Candidatus Uhrbacteria bacterium]|nr:substrate-binding domain-containing protein [Candidatus Uhrbacteria bacterium]
MKKPMIVGIIILLVVLISAVSFLSFRAVNSTTGTIGDLQNRIVISGSSSSISILTPIAEKFQEENPDIEIQFLPGTASGDGIIGVANELIDIGALARPINESEAELYPDVVGNTFVMDAMVLGVHNSVTVKNLSSDEVRKIHSGEISNWSEVGGEDAIIILLDREESESSKILLREVILGDELVISETATLLHTSESLETALEDIPNSVGQTSFGAIKMKGLDFNALAIDGIAPSVATIKNGKYKMVRNYGIAYKESNLSKATEDFIDFIFSSEAEGILESYDFVPVAR